ncbi:hypothetical protein FOA52_007412 [Chlamydomonas sp. UWO 241]|nr:hypothetical protein FOA52_007412 [Chlamydomonas sp. UWO 241]
MTKSPPPSSIGERDGLTSSLLGGQTEAGWEDAQERPLEFKLQLAYTISWVVNFLLLGAKAYAFWLSGSKAVLAALVDSFVDLVSQLVIFVAERQSRRANSRFPVGQARLETIGVLVCALLMALASFQVIEQSCVGLYEGFVKHELPTIEAGLILYAVLGGATLLKAICYVQCSVLASKSDSMVALAEDHLNDIFSNVAAAATAVIAVKLEGAWWADPAGAIAISAYILWRWFDIAKSQVDKIVGRAAPASFIEQLTEIGEAHDDCVLVDCIRAYHVGAKYMVEMEIVMPVTATLKQVHDVALALQHKIEALEPVERAFVHVDYTLRDQPEHRTERLLRGLPVLREETLDS